MFKKLATLLAAVLISTQVFGQASLLPNAKQTFVDINGAPLASGTVDLYVPNTGTRKNTWTNSTETSLNTNPILLDGAGRALIYGQGSYRQVVKDGAGNTQWDALTAAPSSGTSVFLTDAAPVGTMLVYSGLTLPTNYLWANGQALNRTTNATLMAAITSVQAATTVSTSTTIAGLSDTTQIRVGAPIEGTCLNAGTTVATIAGAASITVSAGATSTGACTVTVFPYGNGNGTTTFNAPDMRGRVPAGRDNIGGTAASVLTTAFYGASPDALGVAGGAQSFVLTTPNLPAYTPAGTMAAHSHFVANADSAVGSSLLSSNQLIQTATAGGAANAYALSGSATAATIGLTSATTTTFTGTAQGGTATAFSLIQPSITVNYIIKYQASDPSGSGGVISLGGMTGDILCGSGLTCSGGTISATGGGSGTVTSVATTSPITGGTITTTGTIGCATCVASAAALTANQIVIGAGLQASAVTTTGTGVLTALGVNVGSAGAFVTFNGALGTPSSGTATNLTGLPVGSGISGLGTGVATALAVNVGSAGSFVTFNGALGTPSSGTVTNLTGTATININGTVGATSQNTGQFTSLAYSTTLTGTSANASALAVGRLGATTPAFQVDTTTGGTTITGLQLKAGATTAGVDLTAIGETNVNLRINAAGSGTVSLGTTGTGSVTISNSSATVITLAAAQTRVSGPTGGPQLTFTNDNLSGFGNRSAATFDFSAWANSTEVMRWTPTNITAFTSISGVSAGSTIAFGFNGDSNTGIYSSATDTINFAVQGHSIFQITENTVGVPFVTATAGVIVNPARTIASASGAIWNDIEVSPTTTTFTGTTTVDAIARVAIFSGTLAQTGAGTMTVTLAEGLYVEPPTAGTDVTITNAFAARFAGNIYLNANSYINFTSSSGSGGCGFRDNGGTMQVANCSAPGTWANFGSGGSSTPCTTTALSVQYNAAGSFGCVSGVTSDGTLLQHAAGSFALRDSSAAFNVLINATDPATISATRTLTLGMGNVAHTVNFGTTANTITFPNVASDTVVMVAAAQTLTNKTLTSPAFGGTVTGNNTIPLTILAQSAANTMLGNWTGSTANVSANAMTSCPDSGGNHLNYVSGTGITCGTSGAAGSLTVGTSTIASGTSGRLLYDNAGVLGETAAITYVPGGVGPLLTIIGQVAADKVLIIRGATSQTGALQEWQNSAPTPDALMLPGGLFYVGDGTVSAPSQSFTNDTDTGFYKIGSNNIGLAVGGANILDIASDKFGIAGSSSGLVSIKPQAAAGTYNFNLPTTAGTAGQVLTSQGGGATAMTWASAVADQSKGWPIWAMIGGI